MTDKIIVRPCCICCDALERAERVVEAARALVPGAMAFLHNSPYYARYRDLHDAFADFDAGTNAAIVPTRADMVRDAPGDASNHWFTKKYETAENYLWEGYAGAYNVIAIFGTNDDCAAAAAAMNKATDQHKSRLSVSETEEETR